MKNISFEVKKGEAVGFLGPNGAGKTTTTKMMTGLIYPSEGNIAVLGFKPFDRNKDFLKRIGLVMGNKSGLNWDLSAEQTFILYKEIYEIPDEKFTQRVEYLTNLLEVKDFMKKQVRKLSLGERMKLKLIGAILHDPEILFLDEPTIGLNIIAKKNIRKFLKEIQTKFNITIILTSHDMDDVEQVCDRVIIINKGQKVYDYAMKKLTKEYTKQRFVKFIFEETPQKETLEEYGMIENYSEDSVPFSVESSKMADLIAKISSKYALIDIDIVPIPLEEIIEDIFEKEVG